MEDAKVTHFLRKDALVITLDIANFIVQRLLVDNGSFANIKFLSALKAIGISQLELDKSNSILIGFDGKKCRLSRKIKFLVTAKGITQLTT